MDSTSRIICRTIAKLFAVSILCSAMPYTRPWQPHRRRRWGFGIPATAQSSTSDINTGQLIIHHAWQWLTIQCRACIIQTSSTMYKYAKLRLTAMTTSVAHLRAIRSIPTKMTHLCPIRATHYGAALLHFNFLYGDLVRWLSSGEYTNQHRDWQQIFYSYQNDSSLSNPSHPLRCSSLTLQLPVRRPSQMAQR
jgi:hypothetical protein